MESDNSPPVMKKTSTSEGATIAEINQTDLLAVSPVTFEINAEETVDYIVPETWPDFLCRMLMSEGAHPFDASAMLISNQVKYNQILSPW
jgi:hypothetical protein